MEVDFYSPSDPSRASSASPVVSPAQRFFSTDWNAWPEDADLSSPLPLP